MKKILFSTIALVAALMLAGCQKPAPTPTPEPEDSIVLADGTSATLNISCEEGITDDVPFTANVAWTAEVNADWLIVAPVEGQPGEATIHFAVDANPEMAERTAKATIKGGTASLEITIVQEGKPDPLAAAVDLSASGTANCYMVHAAGTYKIKAVKGNTTEALDIDSADLIWEYTIFGGENAILKDIVVKDGYIFFTTTGTDGNAGIAAKNAAGKILWSWHIWAIPENPEITIGGIVAQKHSLGYIKWDPNDSYSFGLLYQWGRKDPLPVTWACVIKAYPGYEYSTVENHTDGVIGSDGTAVEYSIANPMAFISTNNDTMDWSCISLDKQNKGLWGSTKTIYDPCPVGYRVAGKDFFAAFDATKFVFEITPDATPAHRRIVYDGGVTEFYYSGELLYDNVWNHWEYSGGWTWSCDAPADSAFAYSGYWLGGYDPAKLWYRGNAHAVRCVKE